MRVKPRNPSLSLLPMALLLASLPGCDSGPRQDSAFTASLASSSFIAQTPPKPDGRAVLQALGKIDEPIELEETQAVVNVIVRMTFDERTGGYLVADEAENQIRQYGPRGELVRHFARHGDGPKEFRFLNRAIRLSTGEVLALDGFNKGAVFDSTGSRVLKSFRTPVGPLHSVQLLDDSLALLGGEIRDEQEAVVPGARLHLWNLNRDTLIRSFFVPAIRGQARQMASGVGGFVATDTRGDTIAAVFALTDTIFLFDRAGNRLGQVPIPFKHFRELREGASMPEMNEVVGAREWVGTFSLISHVFWLKDGSFLVQYQDRIGTEPSWRLLHMRRDGQVLFEHRDTPKLLNVDRANDYLVFTSPGSETQNAWSRVRLAGR
jgi:hypothetical protein